MIKHQVALLKHEREDAWLRLAKADEDIQRLIEINGGLNRQIIELHRELREKREIPGQHSGHAPTWDMKLPSTEEVLGWIDERNATDQKSP